MAIKIQGSTIIDDSRKVINASHVGIGTTNPTVELDVDGQANISGIVTASSFVKSSNSGGFLKADGTEDTSTYLTNESQTLDDVVGLGSATTQTITVGTATTGVVVRPDGTLKASGIVTASKYVVQGGSSTGFLKADGSIDSSPYATGTGSLDSIVVKDNNQNVGSASTFTSLDFYNGIGVSTTGVVGVASISLEDNISISGIFTAASFSGSGSGLTSIPTSALVGLATDADKLDGQEGTYYLNYSNFSGIATDSDKLDGQDGSYYLNYSNFSGIATDSDKLDGQDGSYYLNYANFSGIATDSDKLDGQQGSYYLNYSNFSGIATDSDKLDGQHGSYYLNYSNFSGIATDSDKLDGIQASSFLRSDVADTKSSGDLTFSDNIKLNLGSGGQQDSSIFHDATNTKFINRTGDLILETIDTGEDGAGADIVIKAGTGKTSVLANVNGAVELWNNGSKKFETVGTGVSISSGTASTATIYGPGNLIIDPAPINNNGGIVRIKGDLYIDGTTTEINSTTLTIDDLNVVVASGATNGLTADGAGLSVAGAGATIKYNYNGGSEQWVFNKAPYYNTNRLLTTADEGTGNGLDADTLDGQDGTYYLNYSNFSGIATDSDKLDGIDSTSFLRSDAADVKTSGNLQFDPNVKLLLGSAHGELVYDNTDVLFYSGTPDIRIGAKTGDTIFGYSSGAGTSIARFNNAGSIELNYANNKKFETTTNGIAVSGIVTAISGVVTYYGDGSQLTGISVSPGGSDGQIQYNNNGSFGGAAQLYYDDANNRVGIGSSAPTETLDVQGTVHISKAASTFSPHLELFAENSDGGILIAKHASSYPNLTFRGEAGGGSSDYFSGVINEQLSNGIYKTGLKLNDNKTLIFGTGGDSFIEYDPTPGVLEIKTVVAEPITVHTNDTERLRITSDGNIGIGLTQPTAKLDVNGTLNVSGIITATGFVKSGGTSSQFLKADGSVDSSTYITSADGGDAATLDGIDSTSFLRSDVNDIKTAGYLRFEDGVQLTFGTGADMEIFHNGNDGYVRNNVTGNLYLANTFNDGDVIIQSDNGSGGNATYFLADGSSGEAILYHYGTQKLATKSNGIDVTGHTETDTLNVSGVSTLGTVKISSGIVTASSGVVTYYGDGSNLTGIATIGSRWITTGYTGIGTTSAVGIGTIIEVIPYDTQNNGTLSFEGSAGQLFSITNNLTTGSIFSVNDVSGIPSIDVDADGTIQLAPFGSTEFVGIGTTNPTAKLDVNGTVALGSSVYDANGTFGTNGQVLSNVTGFGVSWTTVSGGGGGSVAGSDGQIQYNNNGSFGGAAQLYYDDTNNRVGINSSTPTSTLDVNGTLNVSGISTIGNIEINGNTIENTNAGGALILAAKDNLQLRVNSASSNLAMVGNNGGSVDLYYNNAKKFETTGYGVSVTGGLNVSGISTFGDELHVGYQKEIYFANNSDYNAFQISQNGNTQSLLKNNVSGGNIIIATGNAGSGYVQITNASGSETAAKFTPGGATELHHDGNKKLETTSGGVNVTGILTATSEVFVGSGADTVTLKDGSVFYNNYTSSKFRGNTLQITVKVISKSTHRYSGGSTSAYEIDGVEAPFLTFVPGMTYSFGQSDASNATHPLRFYLDADKTTEYTEGVTTAGTPGSGGAYTQIVVTESTPSILYYQCSAHDYMGNAIQTHGSTLVDGRHVAAPNATVPVHSLSGIGTETNIDVALVPKGTGAILGNIPDGTTTGGNKRGDYAVDLQLGRTSASQVASGQYSAIIGGNNNSATAQQSAVVGGTNNATSAWQSFMGGGSGNTIGGGADASAIIGGYNNVVNIPDVGCAIFGSSYSQCKTSYSTIIGGYYNEADAQTSVVIGGMSGSTKGIEGIVVFPANYRTGFVLGTGEIQATILNVAKQTTNATPTVLVSNNSSAGSNNQMVLKNNSAVAFKGTCIAGVTGAGNTKAWEFRGAIKRGANAASTTLVGSVIKDVLAYDAGAAAWDVDFTADTTNGALKVTVTGQASTTIRWVCKIETTEMAF